MSAESAAQHVLGAAARGEDPVAVLQLPRGCSLDAARASFKRLARLLHPDKNPSKDAAAAFNCCRAALEQLELQQCDSSNFTAASSISSGWSRFTDAPLGGATQHPQQGVGLSSHAQQSNQSAYCSSDPLQRAPNPITKDAGHPHQALQSVKAAWCGAAVGTGDTWGHAEKGGAHAAGYRRAPAKPCILPALQQSATHQPQHQYPVSAGKDAWRSAQIDNCPAQSGWERQQHRPAGIVGSARLAPSPLVQRHYSKGQPSAAAEGGQGMVSGGNTLSSDQSGPEICSSGEDSGAELHAPEDYSGSGDNNARDASLADGRLQRQNEGNLGHASGTAWRKAPEQSRFPFTALLPPPSVGLGTTTVWPVKRLQTSNAGDSVLDELLREVDPDCDDLIMRGPAAVPPAKRRRENSSELTGQRFAAYAQQKKDNSAEACAPSSSDKGSPPVSPHHPGPTSHPKEGGRVPLPSVHNPWKSTRRSMTAQPAALTPAKRPLTVEPQWGGGESNPMVEDWNFGLRADLEGEGLDSVSYPSRVSEENQGNCPSWGGDARRRASDRSYGDASYTTASGGGSEGEGACAEAAVHAPQPESASGGCIPQGSEGGGDEAGVARPAWRKAASAQLAIRGFLQRRVQTAGEEAAAEASRDLRRCVARASRGARLRKSGRVRQGQLSFVKGASSRRL